MVPKTFLDLDIYLIYLYSFQYVQPLQRKWTETANKWNFSESKGHNSNKKDAFVPKTELDLDIYLICLYTEFYFNMCNLCKENERKLQISGIFLSPRGITLSKMVRYTQNRTWPRYLPDKTVYQISFQYVQWLLRKWTETKWTDRPTDRPTDSSKAICPPFFEGGHN
jgi:hypothetical protein